MRATFDFPALPAAVSPRPHLPWRHSMTYGHPSTSRPPRSGRTRLPSTSCSRRYVHRHADRHQWAPAVLDEVLGMLGLTEVAA